MRYLTTFSILFLMLIHQQAVASEKTAPPKGLKLNSLGYLELPGLEITVFADTFPEGHQSGVTIIQHGKRVAANGDIRLEPTPGPWSPTPKIMLNTTIPEQNKITQSLTYPDPSRNGKGVNPIEYPKLNFSYKVNVVPKGDDSFVISVDLSKPLPQEWIGKIGFNLELYPEYLVGKSYLIDKQVGIFPYQANFTLNQPLADGRTLVIAPENDQQRLTIHSKTGPLRLWDGRSKHNDGWFIVRSLVQDGTAKNAVEWTVTPNVDENWRYEPVLQVSQVGYAPKQTKIMIIEQDKRDLETSDITLFEITNKGKKAVFKNRPTYWGPFLRYEYFTFNFSYIDKPGLYVAEYKGRQSHTFRIDSAIYNQNVWQPTLEYFLPVQMCHMQVIERNKIWHDKCHKDDALMSPSNHNHFKGYFSSAAPLTEIKPFESVPQLNHGGWHSGGQTDLDLKNQLESIWFLTAMIEEFGLKHDTSTIDQAKQTVLIHKADGIPDPLQHIEHGLISILTAYETMGRLYHGIISPTEEQFSQIGEVSAQTDGQAFNGKNTADDRWVFIERSPDAALEAAAVFAASARVLQSYRPELSRRALAAAKNLYIENHTQSYTISPKIFALTELYLTTKTKLYLNAIIEIEEKIILYNKDTAWRLARILPSIDNRAFKEKLSASVIESQNKLLTQTQDNPYSVPYKKNHQGISRLVEDYGIQQYFLHKAWPQYVSSEGIFNALNFILGVHPGNNTAAFVSGVGSNSAMKAHGANRADASYIPGGVIAGTSISQPDLPELLNWPYLKQQTDYNIANANAFMFLTLAADQLSQ